MTDEASALPQPGSRARTRSLTDRTLNGFLWSFSGAGMQTVLKIGALAILARLLTPAEFGVVGAAMIVISFTEIFSQLGVGQAIVQKPDLTEEHIRTGMTFSACLGFLMGGLVFAMSRPIEAAFRIEDLQPVVEVLALAFPIKGFSLVADALLQRWMQFRTLAVLSVFSYLFGYAAVAIVLALMGWGVMALVCGQLAQLSLMAAGSLIFARRSMGFTLKIPALSQLLSFGGGHSLGRIGNYVALNADNFIVARWLGAEALGIYGRAYQFLMQPTNLLGSIGDRVLFPAFSSVQQEDQRAARAYRLTVALIAMTTLPLSAILVVLAPEIIRLLLGQQWTDVTLPFQILAAGLLFRVGYKASAIVARAKGAVYRIAWRQWLYAFLVAAGAWTGHFAGLNGVALGVVAAVAVQFMVMQEFGRRLTGMAFDELILIHLRHLTTALLVAGSVLACKMGLQTQQVSDIAVLLASLLVATLTLGLLRLSVPRLFGDEGKWIMSRFKDRLGRSGIYQLGARFEDAVGPKPPSDRL